MMEITYKRKHDESYMIIESQCKSDSYENHMIEENEIKSLLDITGMEYDGVSYKWYKISKMEALCDYIEGVEFTKSFLEKFVIYLHLCLEEVSKYLIDVNHLSINPETVFLQNKGEGFDIRLCYLGSDQGSLQEQFRSIMEFFLSKVSKDDKEFASLIFSIYELCNKEDYTLLEIVDLLNQENEIVQNIEVEQVEIKDEEDFSVYQEEFDRNMNKELLSDYVDEEDEISIGDFLRGFLKKRGNEKKRIKHKGEKQMEDFIVEPDVEICEPTVLLTEKDTKPLGKLVYEGENVEDNFIINQETFRIGSRHGKNNGIINSKAVSRNHAKIIHTEDGYYIEDLNSTNGTRVNGRQLNYREPKKLKPLDSILFADAAYVFL